MCGTERWHTDNEFGTENIDTSNTVWRNTLNRREADRQPVKRCQPPYWQQDSHLNLKVEAHPEPSTKCGTFAGNGTGSGLPEQDSAGALSKGALKVWQFATNFGREALLLYWRISANMGGWMQEHPKHKEVLFGLYSLSGLHRLDKMQFYCAIWTFPKSMLPKDWSHWRVESLEGFGSQLIFWDLGCVACLHWNDLFWLLQHLFAVMCLR